MVEYETSFDSLSAAIVRSTVREGLKPEGHDGPAAGCLTPRVFRVSRDTVRNHLKSMFRKTGHALGKKS